MSSIQKNFAYNTIYQFLLILLPLITAPYLARTLGVTAIGIYAYTNSVAYYFLLTGALGISQHGNRSIAMVRDNPEALNRTFSGIVVLQFVTYLFTITAYLVYLFGFVKDNRLIAGLQIIYIFSGMLDISWLFFGLEQFKTTVTKNTAIKVLTLLAVFVFVHDSGDLWKYTLIMVLGQFGSQLYLWWYLRRVLTPVRVSIREVLAHLKPVLILFVPVLAYSIYKVMDKIMLGAMADYDQVGMYNCAEKVISIPIGILTAFSTVMLPRITHMASKGETANIFRYIRISTKFITVVASAVGFGLMGISKIFTEVFYGTAYADCSGLIILLASTVFFIGWANISRTQYLIPMHLDRIYLLSTAFGALINLGMNLYFIPRFQASGAAIGTILAELTVMLIQVVAIHKEVPILRYIITDFPVLFIGMTMSVLVWKIGSLLGASLSVLLLQICVGAVFFIGILLIYWKLSRDLLWEMSLPIVNSILRRKKS